MASVEGDQDKGIPPEPAYGGFGRAYQIECYPERGGRLHLVGVCAVAVYHVLCSHAGPQRPAYPSVLTIMKALNKSEAAVRRALKKLREHGLIRITEVGGGRSKATKYLITPPGLSQNQGKLPINPVTDDMVSVPNPATDDRVSPGNPIKGETLSPVNPVTPDPKPCQPCNNTLSPVIPKQIRAHKEHAACSSDLLDRLKELGVKGRKLGEVAALANLTVEQINAVFNAAQSKSNAGGNPIGLMIRMLLDGERGERQLAVVARTHARHEAHAKAHDQAQHMLNALPAADDPGLKAEATAWAKHFGEPHVLTIAKEAVPHLRVRDANCVETWIVAPEADPRVLIACYAYARTNYINDERFAGLYSAESKGKSRDSDHAIETK